MVLDQDSILDRASSVAALARLTGLRSLDLCDCNTTFRPRNVLACIGSLQRLTELCLRMVTPDQLQPLQLPPLLQHMDLTVDLGHVSSSLMQLGDWLASHGSMLRRLDLVNVSCFRAPNCPSHAEEWTAAVHHVATVLHMAGAAPSVRTAEAPAAAALATSWSATAAVGTRLQLQSFLMDALDARPILHCLPADRMTHLKCSLDYSSAQHWDSLCALTALRSLCLDSKAATGAYLCRQQYDVLAPLSALSQLTQLRLEEAGVKQLQRVPSWLQVLEVSLVVGEPGQLQLAHLTVLSALYNAAHVLC